MTEESRLMMSIWDRFADFISANEKQEAANTLVGVFLSEGTDLRDLMDAEGECTQMDRALAEHKANDDNFIEDLYDGYDNEE